MFDNNVALAPEHINEAHMPILLLLDVSGSMAGKPIENLSLAVNRFASDVCKDSKAIDLVDTCVMTFNSTVSVVQDWRPISKMDPLSFYAGGGTDLSLALNTAITKMRERTNLYKMQGIECKTPYLILVSDGYGGDVTEVSELIKERTDDKKMKLWTLCVQGYDAKTIASLTEGKRVFELKDSIGFDFTDFFDFMAVSVKAVSTSAPGEFIHVENPLENPDTNLQVPDLDEWLN